MISASGVIAVRLAEERVRTSEAAVVGHLLHDLVVFWIGLRVQTCRVEEVAGNPVEREAVEQHLH